MTGKVLQLDSILQEDNLGTAIARFWVQWQALRQIWLTEKEEVRKYVFATDTTKTSNAKLPWKNKTTVPKLCQIRDNLYSNYSASLFPQRKWLVWEANNHDSNSKVKRDAIENYMAWVIDQSSFKAEMDKLILDYIDYGNCFVMPEWVDERVLIPGDKTQVGYVGPTIRRISPLDIVFNPTAESFEHTPKIIRSLVSVGEVKGIIEGFTNTENKEEYEKLWDYLKEIRLNIATFKGDMQGKDNQYMVDGFTNFQSYLLSGYCELLTFYGDIYDPFNDEYIKNHKIMVVDRHKVIYKEPNPSFFGYPPIRHSSWRKRQDNLWGMGPLDNLVGMQYRIDHLENLKADVWDLTAFPVIMVKGVNQEFTWGPMERIYVEDAGDVKMVVPDANALNANLDIQNLERLMEEMAGAPKEAVGFRTPGEKTKYEVQRLENASSRVFQNKIKQFEEQVVETSMNDMLELSRRNISDAFTISVMDDEFNMQMFQELTVDDITGIGRIKPIAARHFAEQADLVQNLTNLANSPLWPTIQPHVSGVGLAKMFENIFNMEDYSLIMPFIAITEQSEGQQMAHISQEQAAMNATTPSGLRPDDFNAHAMGAPPQGPGQAGGIQAPTQK